MKKAIPAFTKSQLKKQGIPQDEIDYLINFMIIPIDKLTKDDWNYKTQDKFKSEKLKKGLQILGQVENIHVRQLPTGLFAVVNGEHRFDQLMDLGRKSVMAYNHGNISQEEAIKRAIMTNETRFDNDQMKLASLISDLHDNFDPEDLLGIPFSQDEIDSFMDLADMSINQTKSQPQDSDNDPTVKNIQFKVPVHVYEKWLSFRKRMNTDGSVNREKVFELMVTISSSMSD